MDHTRSMHGPGGGTAERSFRQIRVGVGIQADPLEGSTIYMVGNDTRTQEELKEMLSWHGYKVEAFHSSDKFLSLPRPNAPACVIVDLNQGDCDGLALQQQLAGDARMPIIFLS